MGKEEEGPGMWLWLWVWAGCWAQSPWAPSLLLGWPRKGKHRPHLGSPFEGFLFHPISHPSHHNLFPPIACSYCSATSILLTNHPTQPPSSHCLILPPPLHCAPQPPLSHCPSLQLNHLYPIAHPSRSTTSTPFPILPTQPPPSHGPSLPPTQPTTSPTASVSYKI